MPAEGGDAAIPVAMVHVPELGLPGAGPLFAFGGGDEPCNDAQEVAIEGRQRRGNRGLMSASPEAAVRAADSVRWRRARRLSVARDL